VTGLKNNHARLARKQPVINLDPDDDDDDDDDDDNDSEWDTDTDGQIVWFCFNLGIVL